MGTGLAGMYVEDLEVLVHHSSEFHVMLGSSVPKVEPVICAWSPMLLKNKNSALASLAQWEKQKQRNLPKSVCT